MADSPRIDELRRRVQSDPASIAFAALAEEYRRAGRFEEAISACITGLQRHPSYLSAHVTLGRALLEVGRYEEAQDELEYVLKHAPENLAAIRGLAEIHHRRGDDAHENYNVSSDAARREAATAQPDLQLKPDATGQASPAEAPADLRLAAEGAEPPTADLGLAPEGPHPPRVSDEPALAGLEEFLAAIQRARASARR